jgi:hypothetical protein
VQVQASLIVVYTHTGQTAELVAKYRPPMPILTLVVPHLVNDGLKWKLEGRWVHVGGRVEMRHLTCCVCVVHVCVCCSITVIPLLLS